MKRLVLLVLLSAASTSQAQIYKWVDAKGVVHYSDNKFDAGDAPVREIKPNGAPSPVLPAGVTWQQRDAEFRRLQQHKLMAPAYRSRQLQASNCTADKEMRTVCR